MDIIIGIIFLILTYVVFVKFPAPAPLITWGFVGVLTLLNLSGTVDSGFVFLSYIMLIIILMISAVLEANT